MRSLKPPHSRCAIDVDAVDITSYGKNGQSHIYVLVNLVTKLTALSVGTSVFAENLILTIWKTGPPVDTQTWLNPIRARRNDNLTLDTKDAARFIAGRNRKDT